MTPKEPQREEIAPADKELVLASLELDQLAALKKQPIPRRRLSRLQIAVLWSLRAYVLFMIAAVFYQAWVATH